MLATRSTWALDLGLAGLGEDRADGGGDHLLVALADLGQHVAHEVDPAALRATALEHGRDGVDQAAVGVADDELDPAEAALAQLAQELGPNCSISLSPVAQPSYGASRQMQVGACAARASALRTLTVCE
jgi:hypothetical protein